MGASFAVYIPYASGASASSEAQPEKSVWPDITAATVLFVDDDDEVRVLASRLLAKGGHHVLVASNAGEALLIADSYGPSIDLLVTDTVMPFMDGHSLARRICAKIPSVGLLFISGHPGRGNDPEDEGRFLAKPFTEAELAQAVTRALSQARRAESQAH
jgi:two-component system cell cycle sensor histidine kinase/response regulator CckA